MGKKTVSGFKKRMLVLQCLLRHGEKSINELVDLQLFEMEKICRDYSAEIDKLISEWPTGEAKAVESRQE